MKLGSRAGMAFGHLLAQLEFWNSLATMPQQRQTAIQSLFPGIKTDSFTKSLAVLIKELKEADATWREVETGFHSWRDEYDRMFNSVTVLFDSVHLVVPKLAPGL